MIIGFTIIKNALKEHYPIDLVIKQHKDLFDLHYIGVPLKDQDEDGTRALVERVASECGQNIELMELDWPGGGAWSQESLDKILQQKIVEEIDSKFTRNDWVIKIDADEFYHEDDFPLLKEIIDISLIEGAANWNSIVTGYLQFCGSLENTIFDPTQQVFHIFRNQTGARFVGNDAMAIMPHKNPIHTVTPLKLHHIGYVKSRERISTRIKEHMVLNGSVYQKAYGLTKEQVDEKVSNYEFEFPAHRKGAKLWPLGIAVLFGGAENFTEYKPFNPDLLPRELLKEKDNMRFFTPEIG